MDIRIIIGLALLCFIGLVVFVIGVSMVYAIYHSNKLMWGLPWLRWLTLDEIVEMGFSRFWSQMLLPLFYEKGYLEVRLSDRCPEERRWVIERMGFCSYSLKYYDFKLTKRGGRKKEKSLWKPIVPVWNPAST